MRSILLFFTVLLFYQVNAQTNIEVEIPKAFLNEMFRSPNDKYLVAWSGGVQMAITNKSGEVIQSQGVITAVEDFLNSEFTQLTRRHFKYNLKTPPKRITTPDNRKWAAHCGYDPNRNISFQDIRMGKGRDWPEQITTDVWGLNFSKKTSIPATIIDEKSGKRDVITVALQATSIFYYHKNERQDLKGEIKRTDGYKLCGKVGMYRLGPGRHRFKVYTELDTNQFEFTQKLYLGDYMVQYLWPDGTFVELDPHIVYDPFGNPQELSYEIETFKGEITGSLKNKETFEWVKNQQVKLKPECEDSGLPEMTTTSDENGKFTFSNVPTGVYIVETRGAEPRNAGLTDKSNPKVNLGEIRVNIESKYDVFLTYNAPNFSFAKVVWENVEVAFPVDNKEIQTLDISSYNGDESEDMITGTDGKPIKLPYQMKVPGMGTEIFYGLPEEEYGRPKVISVKKLGSGYKTFDGFSICLEEDALNDFVIHKVSTSGITIDFSFDLRGYAEGRQIMQLDVSTISQMETKMLGTENYRAQPLLFPSIKLNQVAIEKLRNGEEMEFYSNSSSPLGNATVTIQFQPKTSEE
ncbi:hypothetical protein EMN47_16100 [Prolixibacteraceae bacterium JC049]|nr:hypothetical protein [Prolixibacteraceae bacterium JC049]